VSVCSKWVVAVIPVLGLAIRFAKSKGTGSYVGVAALATDPVKAIAATGTNPTTAAAAALMNLFFTRLLCIEILGFSKKLLIPR
jgi:hypothetical protein